MTTKHPVPYVSQRTDTARFSINDCGIAAADSMIQAYTDLRPTVDEIYRKIRIFELGALAVSTVKLAMEAYGLNIIRRDWRNNIDQHYLKDILNYGHPFVVLVDYRPVMAAGIYQYPIYGGHFVTVVGYDHENFIVHDPYWDFNGGAYIKWPNAVFERAWNQPGTQYARIILLNREPLRYGIYVRE